MFKFLRACLLFLLLYTSLLIQRVRVLDFLNASFCFFFVFFGFVAVTFEILPLPLCIQLIQLTRLSKVKALQQQQHMDKFTVLKGYDKILNKFRNISKTNKCWLNTSVLWGSSVARPPCNRLQQQVFCCFVFIALKGNCASLLSCWIVCGADESTTIITLSRFYSKYNITTAFTDSKQYCSILQWTTDRKKPLIRDFVA